MKRITLLAALCNVLIFSCKEKTTTGTYTLSGTISGLDSGAVYMFSMFNMEGIEEEPDTTVLVNGSFTFSGAIDEPRFVFLSLGDDIPHQPLGLFLEEGTIEVQASLDSLQKATVKGSATQDDFVRYQKQFTTLSDQQRALIEEYQEADMAADIAKMTDVQKRFQDLESKGKAMTIDFVKANPTSYFSAFLLAQNFNKDAEEAELRPLYEGLDDKIKQSYFGKETGKVLDIISKTGIGAIPPDFTLNDPNGQPVSLHSFKGKYTLVDFWAAWCGPCRRENPTIVKAYHDYKDKGFDILGVSLDEKEDAWLKAIADDQLVWTQVSDLKGWNSAAAKLYGIESIPMNFLLDPEGKIIARNLRGADLIAKLGEVLD